MEKNVYTNAVIVLDAEGKKHRVYPAPILKVSEVAAFVATVNVDFLFSMFLVPDVDVDGSILRDDESGKVVYGKAAMEEALDIVEIALRWKESREDISKWLDVCTLQQILLALIGLSQIEETKKKVELVTKK